MRIHFCGVEIPAVGSCPPQRSSAGFFRLLFPLFVYMKRSYTLEQRNQVLGTLDAARNSEALSSTPVKDLVALAAGTHHPPSSATIYRWERESLTGEEYRERLGRRGKRKLLTPEQTHLVLGYLCHRRSLLLVVSQRDLIDFISTHFNKTVSPPFITKLMQDHNVSSQRSMNRDSRMTTPKVVDDAIAFIEEVRSYNYPPERIIIMDETCLWSNVVKPRTYHFVGGYSFTNFFLLIDFEFLPRPFRLLFPLLLQLQVSLSFLFMSYCVEVILL